MLLHTCIPVILKLIHEVCSLRKASVTDVGWAKLSVNVILLNSAGDIYINNLWKTYFIYVCMHKLNKSSLKRACKAINRIIHQIYGPYCTETSVYGIFIK